MLSYLKCWLLMPCLRITNLERHSSDHSLRKSVITGARGANHRVDICGVNNESLSFAARPSIVRAETVPIARHLFARFNCPYAISSEQCWALPHPSWLTAASWSGDSAAEEQPPSTQSRRHSFACSHAQAEGIWHSWRPADLHQRICIVSWNALWHIHACVAVKDCLTYRGLQCSFWDAQKSGQACARLQLMPDTQTYLDLPV